MSIALQLRLWFRAVIVLELKVKITSQIFIVKFFLQKQLKKKASTLKFDFVTTKSIDGKSTIFPSDFGSIHLHLLGFSLVTQ